MRPGANPSLRKLKTYRGRVIDDIGRRIVGNEDLQEAFVRPLFLARRVLEQERRQRGRNVYSLHAPAIECIGKGKSTPGLRVRGQGERRHHAARSAASRRRSSGSSNGVPLIAPNAARRG